LELFPIYGGRIISFGNSLPINQAVLTCSVHKISFNLQPHDGWQYAKPIIFHPPTL